MYIAASRTSDLAAGTDRKPALKRVSANVVALGMVSLVTDVSSEMVTAVLPLYLVLGLGLNPLQFGLLDGLYAGATALVRVLGGHLADRWRRLKAVAGFGYGLSAVCKLGLVAAGSSVAAIGVVLAADRTGKGLRTGPRDALISLSSEPGTLGRSFGVHRALDTVGAFLGPLVAMAVGSTRFRVGMGPWSYGDTICTLGYARLPKIARAEVSGGFWQEKPKLGTTSHTAVATGRISQFRRDRFAIPLEDCRKFYRLEHDQKPDHNLLWDRVDRMWRHAGRHDGR